MTVAVEESPTGPPAGAASVCAIRLPAGPRSSRAAPVVPVVPDATAGAELRRTASRATETRTDPPLPGPA